VVSIPRRLSSLRAPACCPFPTSIPSPPGQQASLASSAFSLDCSSLLPTASVDRKAEACLNPPPFRLAVVGGKNILPSAVIDIVHQHARVEVTNLFATEDRAVVECILRGTQTGPLQGLTGALPPSGRSMSLQACEVHQVRNGMIVSHHTYYDLLGLLQQLGALPAAG
jgi:hypothetical protein